MSDINIQELRHRLHMYQMCSELLQLLYRSSKYYEHGGPELRKRIGFANGERNATFESIYDMSANKQQLLIGQVAGLPFPKFPFSFICHPYLWGYQNFVLYHSAYATIIIASMSLESMSMVVLLLV